MGIVCLGVPCIKLVAPKIGPLPQQLLGAITITVLLLFLAPAFQSIAPSVGLMAGALLGIGLSTGLMIPTHPLLMMRILERDAGLTKDELGGALATTSTMFMMFGALVGPTVSSNILVAAGFARLTIYSAVFYAVVYLSCLFFLRSYNVQTGLY